jgi:MoaA/NifB/PqqE/SkfB family radical SAM enzyme
MPAMRCRELEGRVGVLYDLDMATTNKGGMNRRDAGELLTGQDVVQLFRAMTGTLAFASPVLATYQRQLAGSITLSLHRMPPDFSISQPLASLSQHRNRRQRLLAALRARLRRQLARLHLVGPPVQLGEQLATLTLPCRELMDCEALDFAVGPPNTVPGELLALRIRTQGTRTGSAPTLWLTESKERIPGHVACYVGADAQGEYGAQASLTYETKTSVPRMLLYSPVTQCNLNCIHCISAHTRTRADRLSDHVKRRMQEWSSTGQLETISSDYSGDILWADSRFGNELDFIFGLGIPFHIDTNGVYLTAQVAERLCQSRIATLNISLDAAEEETFKRVRKGAPPLREVLENIETLMRARAAAGADFTVSISFTLMRSTLREWPDFLRLGAKLGVDIVIARHLEAFTAGMEADSLWHDQAAFNAARPEIAALAETLGITATIPPPFSGVARTGRKVCSVPWHSAVLLGNGDVAACCVPGLVMGNLNETTMEEIWNGLRYQELRATVNSPTPLPPCASCPMFRHTDNPDSYLIHSAMQRLLPASPQAARKAPGGYKGVVHPRSAT